MATYTGIVLKLKDKSTKLEDKIKLATFAWVSEEVCIPNKHQSLVDFISGLLINREKHNLQDNDVILVWRTLDKFFHALGSAVITKPSFLQLIIESLSALCTADTKGFDKGYIACMLRCLKQFLLSQPVSVSYFKALLSLASVICQLMLNPKFDFVHRDLEELLDCSIALLAKCYRTHVNKTQAINSLADKALKHSLMLLSVRPCPNLTEFLISSLLSEDLHEKYVKYLTTQTTLKTGQKDKISVKNGIGNILTLMSTHCIQIKSSSLFTFLPQFLKAFAQHKLTNPEHCFLMLRHFVDLILSTQSQGQEPSLSRLIQCVQACQDSDIFSTSGNQVLKWFSQLTEKVLGQPRSQYWFQYMSTLLAMNHLVVEKHWADVLRKCFNPESIEFHTDLDMFLSDLVQKYVKLRRTSDLLTVLLSCLADKTNELIGLDKMTQFHRSLCKMFAEVPQATMLELWGKLQTSTENLIQKSGTAIVPGLEWTLSMYTCLLENARAFEHRSGDVLRRKVCELVGSLEENILQPLVKKKSALKHHSVAQLLRAWTVVKILLFPRFREEGQEGEAEAVRREATFKKITKVLDADLHLHLSMQRVGLATSTGSKSASELMSKQADIEKVVSNLLHLPHLTREVVLEPKAIGSGEVTPKQLALSQFQKFTQLYPLISNKLPDELLDRCGQFIVDVLCTAETNHMTPEANSTNLFLEVQNFLAHPATRELAKLQERIMVSVWRKIFSACQKSSEPNKKKKKLSCENTGLVQYLTGDVDHCCVTDLELRLDLEVKPYFELLISTLGSLDLEYLPQVNLRYQLGLLLMLGSLEEAVADRAVEVRRCVKQQLAKLLSAGNLSILFQFVKPRDLLSLLEKCKQDNESDLNHQLLQNVMRGVMNDHEAILDMPSYTQQIIQDLVGGRRDVGKMKILAQMIRYCHKYLTKSFRLSAVKDSALEIYFAISKFLIKHGLSWFSDSNVVGDGARAGEAKNLKKGRKRKSTGPQMVVDGSAVILECLSEVLNIWSVQVADLETNLHLELMVEEMTDRLLQQPQQIQETETKFLESCCLCQLRCLQDDGSNPNLSSEELHPRKFCFMSEKRLVEVIDIAMCKCSDEVTSVFQRMREEKTSHCDSDLALSQSGGATGCSLEKMELWPKLLAAETDLLASAAVCLSEDRFNQLLQKLMMKLKYDEPSQCPSFYVVAALWRQLLSSSLLSPSLVKILFHYLYEFLSALIGCVTALKSLHPELPLMQRFVLDGLSDLVDLGKMQVSSRIILLCLDAGVAFTLASVPDVQALYRLVNTLLVHHTNTTLTSVSGIVSITKKLICSCIKLGGQQHLVDDARVAEVVACAQLVSRLLTLLSSTTCKTELSKVAHIIVAEYVLGVQEEDFHPIVKNELVKGIYKIMTVCDKFRFASLATSLPPAAKDAFKVLHQEFNKYHRYGGQV